MGGGVLKSGVMSLECKEGLEAGGFLRRGGRIYIAAKNSIFFRPKKSKFEIINMITTRMEKFDHSILSMAYLSNLLNNDIKSLDTNNEINPLNNQDDKINPLNNHDNEISTLNPLNNQDDKISTLNLLNNSDNQSNNSSNSNDFSSDEELDIINRSLQLSKINNYNTNIKLIDLHKSENNLTKYHEQYDIVHGTIKISKTAKVITSHPVFNRLRNIKQLGPLHFKFGYGTHSRYEHSIGVGYLARHTGSALQKKHSNITDREILCLELAGMCHDIGHGPYSHTFDNLLSTMFNNHPCIHHETRSQILFQYMIDDLKKNKTNYIDLTDAEVSLIQYFIDPEKYLSIDLRKYRIEPSFHIDGNHCNNIYKCNKMHLTYTNIKSINPNLLSKYEDIKIDVPSYYNGLEQVVSNYYHKLDVDKIDYLLRDARELRFDDKLLHGIDILGLLERSMIIDNIWMFNIRDQLIVYNLICCRFLFYTSFYLHPDVNAINCMLTDALNIINSVTDISSCALLENNSHISKFCSYDDNNITEFILNNVDERVSKANKLIRDVMQKKWYKHMGDFINGITDLDNSAYTELNWDVFTDKSTPTNLLPKVRYHQNGIPVTNVSKLHRLYMKNV